MTHFYLSACLSLLIVHNLIDRIINFDIDIQKSTLCDFEHQIELKLHFITSSKSEFDPIETVTPRDARFELGQVTLKHSKLESLT